MPVSRRARVLVWCLLSGLAGGGLFALGLFVGAGGHGPELPLTMSFPYAHFLYRINPITDRWLLNLAVFIQFPVYTLVCLSVSEWRKRVLAACALVILHGAALWACFLPHEFYERFW